MQRAVLLQSAATRSKQNLLSEFEKEALEETNSLLSERNKYSKFNDFWQAVGMETKRRTNFNIQVVCDIARSVWRKQKGCSKVKGVTVKFNVPRNCKTFETKSFFFVELGLYPRKRVPIPIKKNRDWERFSKLIHSGWKCKTYGLTPSLEIVAFLSKKEEESRAAPQPRNILGVDINSKCFALSLLSSKGNLLKQLYLGKDIWQRRRHIFERKSLLQSYADTGSPSTQKKLDRTKQREHNFVKNRIGEVVRDITNLALNFNADISIENLKRFNPKGKRFNREVMRIPFYAFRRNLEQRCFDKRIELNIVDSWHTSKWCSRCGAVGKTGHDPANYSLFRCKACGQVVNSDRKASLAIAAKSLLERSPNAHSDIQISNRKVPVNGLVRRPDASGGIVAEVQIVSPLNGKLTGFSRG